ncbi:hypothetical protein LTR97_008772 [Elasticomyces elasticus]|uniref:Uncharacterized protein n=1 Tax=Elasticomyces elasticus TaxID=574655 RepID=A0AAN7ZM92_9PEZI|nr:hypothetical protein LTR97_008772 [Elasticomyces elasticus]
MATVIPPLDFTRSPDSFSTACEVQSNEDWEDSSSTTSVQSAIPVPDLHQDGVESEDDDRPSGWSGVVEAVQQKRRDTVITIRPCESPRSQLIESPHSKLVKRRPLVKPSKAASTTANKDWKSYRCDIHAHPRTSYSGALSACTSLILEAGGVLIPFIYPGGVLYQLPPKSSNPLKSGDTIDAAGSHITIASWTAFPPAEFSGLKMGHVYGRSDEKQLLPLVRAVKRQTMMETSDVKEKLWSHRKSGVAKRCMSAWLGMVARDYGKGVSYIA